MGFLKVSVLLLMLISSSSMAVSLDPNGGTDHAALLAFKRLITVDPSGIIAGWDPLVRSHCDWHGVTCNALSGRVTGLDLAGTKLTGNLASDLGSLTELRFLSLSHNNFSGEIPAAIGLLRKLEVLDLSYNSLLGQISSDLIGLAPLKSIDLSFNLLSGRIKLNNPDCKSLNHLKLSGNLLVGPIPPQIGKCSNLQTLLLDGNNLEGHIPAELGTISELRVLDVSMNSLTGEIPKELSNCRRLSVLILTNLVGSSIASISSQLDFNTTEEFNAFTGPIPDEIFSIPKLEILWIPRANIDGRLREFPNSSSSCSLRILNLGQNYITGSIPEWLGLCGNLTYLDISFNNLQGSVPSAFNVQCMAYFNVSRNMLSGNLSGLSGRNCSRFIFSDVFEGGDLSKIYYKNLLLSVEKASPFRSVLSGKSLVLHDFSWNEFNGYIPFFILPVNENISCGLLLNNNLFNGSLYDTLWNSWSDFSGFAVNLSCNRISGEIGMLSNCSPLKSFEAANNSLTGPFPSDIGNLDSLMYIDVRWNNLNGAITNQLGKLKLAEGILLGGNYLSGRIPDQLGELRSIRILDLSKNSLSGAIPSGLADATTLEMLLLDHNYLSGNIPSSFENLSRLTTLNVSFNRLSGVIPHFVHVIDCELFEGNQFQKPCPDLNDASPSILPLNNDMTNSIERKNKLKFFIMASVSSATLIFVVLVLLVIFLVISKVRMVNLNLKSKVVVTFTDTPVELTCSNVLRSTGNFSVQNLIGTGGFGATYRAELLPGYIIAVKRLSMGKFQGLQQFDAEIRTLGRIRHKNLVTLVGYHKGESDTFLIYNYLSGGNLEAFIQNMSLKEIKWPLIHKIALDVALAIAYLHYSCAPRIVHRDIKPSNVLLDEKCNAYLSDFGLARLLEVSQTHATTSVAGTFGYVAPEYAITCRVSDKADVYSFGVVLLELLSGKRSLDPSFDDLGDGFNIVAWGRLLIQEDRAVELFYPYLRETGPMDKLVRILRLALDCTAESLPVRPSMKQVVEVLKSLRN